MVTWGYNTNGFAHHRLLDAIDILRSLGYRAVGITLDYQHLNPFSPDVTRELVAVRRALDRTGMRCVVETGARFLLDPWRKHWPTLLSPSPAKRARRLEFLYRAIEVAHYLRADAVSVWSGAIPKGADEARAWNWLVDGCRRLCERAETAGLVIAFEPEPGMLVERMADFDLLFERVAHPALRLTLDIGHVHCLDDGEPGEVIRRYRHVLANVHIEDMRRGVHDHLPFGEGTVNFGPVIRALREIGYEAGVYVELSRHSHDAVRTAARAIRFLQLAARECAP